VNGWLWASCVLLIGGLGPALGLSLRGDAADRLVGLVLTGPVVVLAMLLLSQGYGQSAYLIVPLTLALLSFAGTLVFTRLLGPER
jgi:multisubunit Na+/H+ antiporter MnhF subunit